MFKSLFKRALMYVMDISFINTLKLLFWVSQFSSNYQLYSNSTCLPLLLLNVIMCWVVSKPSPGLVAPYLVWKLLKTTTLTRTQANHCCSFPVDTNTMLPPPHITITSLLNRPYLCLLSLKLESSLHASFVLAPLTPPTISANQKKGDSPTPQTYSRRKQKPSANTYAPIFLSYCLSLPHWHVPQPPYILNSLFPKAFASFFFV